MKCDNKYIFVVILSILLVLSNNAYSYQLPFNAINTKLEKTTINNIFPINPNLLWLTGDFSNDFSFENSQAVVLNSNDGGKTWGKKFSITNNAIFLKSYFLNEKYGFIIGGLKQKGRIWQTRDGGNSWKLLKYQANDFFIDIKFTSSKNGWILGEDGSVYSTSNSGKLWKYSKIIDAKDLKSFAFKNASEGWAFGYQGQTFTTKDGGKTWIPNVNYFTSEICAEKRKLEFKESVFLNENLGFVGARCKMSIAKDSLKIANDRGIIFTTKTGGKTWESRILTETLGLDFAYFTKRGNGLVIPSFSWQQNGVLFHSIDFGQTWKSLPSPNIEGIPSGVFFLDDKEGWLVSNDGFYIDYLYKTENGGQSWYKLN